MSMVEQSQSSVYYYDNLCNLVVFIGSHQKKSFCHNGIIRKQFQKSKTYEKVRFISCQLYDDEFRDFSCGEKQRIAGEIQGLDYRFNTLSLSVCVWWFRCNRVCWKDSLIQIFVQLSFTTISKKITKTYGIVYFTQA